MAISGYDGPAFLTCIVFWRTQAMKPQTVLSKVPRDKLDATMQAAFDRSLAMHDDATFVETMGHAPHVYHWYQNDFYKKLFY
jgi:hypothetical protein